MFISVPVALVPVCGVSTEAAPQEQEKQKESGTSMKESRGHPKKVEENSVEVTSSSRFAEFTSISPLVVCRRLWSRVEQPSKAQSMAQHSAARDAQRTEKEKETCTPTASPVRDG